MEKNFAWELFKNTGNIDAFMIMKNIESYNKDVNANTEIGNMGESNGDCKN